MKSTKAEKAEQKTEALAWLLKNVKKGDTIYTVMRHTNRMGTYRVASHYIVLRGTIVRIDHYVCHLLDRRRNDTHEGVSYPNHQPPGDVAEHLSYALHGWGRTDKSTGQYILSCKCADKPHPHRCWHKPGYTLRHEWL